MFMIMKKMSIATLTAITLMGIISTPAFSQYTDDYRGSDRRDNNNDELVGGAVGAVVGGVVGSQVAGSGNRTEGAVAGALLGGLLGIMKELSVKGYGVILVTEDITPVNFGIQFLILLYLIIYTYSLYRIYVFINTCSYILLFNLLYSYILIYKYVYIYIYI